MSTALVETNPGQLENRPASMLETVMRAMSDPSLDVVRLREFLEIGKELEARDAKRQFIIAMAAMKPKLPVIEKNGRIAYKPGTKPTTYAKWDDIYRACMPILAEYGFTCSFSSELPAPNVLKVLMTVRHIGGHEDIGALIVPWLDTGGSKSPAQAAASSFTLAQRHAFVKYFDVLTEDSDDDGSGKGVQEPITEHQAMQIEDLVFACAERDPKFASNFKKWIKAEFNADGPRTLFQGDQLNSVMSKLREKMALLGIQ